MPEAFLEKPGAVFVSYPQAGAADTPRWVTRVLRPLLEELLPHAGLGGKPVFLDEVSIPLGGDWPLALQDALREAAVLIPVFTPEYFQRPWCLAELHTMLGRQKRLGHTCVFPVRFSDGDFFSEEARRLQLALDAKPWADVTTYRRAPRPLKEAVRKLCQAVADAARRAPSDPEWQFVVPRRDPAAFLVEKPEYGGEP